MGDTKGNSNTKNDSNDTLNKGILEEAKFAASATGFSQEVVRRWAFTPCHSTQGHLTMNMSSWSFPWNGVKHVAMCYPFYMMKIFNLRLVHTFGLLLTVRESQLPQHKCLWMGEGELQLSDLRRNSMTMDSPPGI